MKYSAAMYYIVNPPTTPPSCPLFREGKGKEKDGSQIADEGASSSEEEEEEEEESAPDMKVDDHIDSCHFLN